MGDVEMPDMLYLQVEDDLNGEALGMDEWTHCVDRVHESDVEYIRADAVATELKLLRDVAKALNDGLSVYRRVVQSMEVYSEWQEAQR